MTSHDYQNLRFLLDSSPEQLHEWYKTVSEDDIKYASALLTIAQLELIDHDVEMMDVCIDAVIVISAVMYGSEQ